MPALTDVPVSTIGPERFEEVLTAEQWSRFRERVRRAAGVFDGRTVWNVNSTAKGGGVAEMLNALLPYVRGAGIDARWTVIAGDDGFFRVTKRIHNHLHGAPGDSPQLGEEEREQYESVTRARAEELCRRVRPTDLVILHDPQTAGMVPALHDCGVPVVWRCHVGLDIPNQLARTAWAFLRPWVRQADAYVFSRQAFVWDGLDAERIRLIAPSIDPFSSKNVQMDGAQVDGVLQAAHLVARDGNNVRAEFRRQDGSADTVRRQAAMTEEAPLGRDDELVLQVSRWDSLKDPLGVVEGFVQQVVPRCDAHLMLAGPAVDEVADDPEGAQTYRAVRQRWEQLPAEVRRRVHLACLPMDDDEENAALVNALQRRATVVVQKSLAEGFGLTVAEAMWKARPVVASRIGGIQDQIEDGVCGRLIDDPRDTAAFGDAVCELLLDPSRAQAMGEAAQGRVREQFLGTRHLGQFATLLGGLLDRTGRL
jgi:trehalose synthase